MLPHSPRTCRHQQQHVINEIALLIGECLRHAVKLDDREVSEPAELLLPDAYCAAFAMATWLSV